MLRWFGYLTIVLVIGVLLAGAGAIWVFWEYGRDLPDYDQLADYQPPVTTRVHAGDGSLIAEYAVERRVFVPIDAIPRRIVDAFLAAEDQHFYDHPGVDPIGIARAVVVNLKNIGSGRRPEGASTITQQVAQNFLLTKEVSLTRKIREALIALRIERAYSKEKILELYLNEIYLGAGSYGVAAAAINYFGKSLDELTVAEAAFLAALPKAPNNYHPVRHPDAARARRNYVVGRMLDDGMISADEAALAETAPLPVPPGATGAVAEAPYFAEEVRRELSERYGGTGLYEGGLSVRTTLDPHLQAIADAALREGLIDYDRRHGWRGPVAHFDTMDDWRKRLGALEPPPGAAPWRQAAVLEVDATVARLGFAEGDAGVIPLSALAWAREARDGGYVGGNVRAVTEVMKVGDIVLVEPVTTNGKEDYPPGTYGLRQIPKIQGAIVALDPHTGRVLAMNGGFAYGQSEFNRATQAWRQPGSAFKPIVYMAALDSGFTPSSQILDAPFVIDQGPGLGKWKPANYSREFYGPSPMRLGIEKSRNLMTVRLAQTVGMPKIAEYARRLGVVDDLPEQLAMSIGAGETTLLRITAAYAMIDNGGKRIVPTLIDRIQDRNGRTVLRHDERSCDGCRDVAWDGQAPPGPPDTRPRVLDAGTAYQMVSMLQGVVERGTGRRISEIGKPLAGKTGTTNDSYDAWFVGFAPDLAVGVYTGFDSPQPLGKGETGSSVAAPIFKMFMEQALADRPAIPFRIPDGIRLVRVNADTGVVAGPGDRSVILEAFKPGTEPYAAGPVLDGSEQVPTEPAGGGGGGGSGIY
jgi:penicillin-binding protein 1A